MAAADRFRFSREALFDLASSLAHLGCKSTILVVGFSTTNCPAGNKALTVLLPNGSAEWNLTSNDDCDVLVANYKIGRNIGAFSDFDTMPGCTTSSSFSSI
jgi:hypothetical protein